MGFTLLLASRRLDEVDDRPVRCRLLVCHRVPVGADCFAVDWSGSFLATDLDEYTSCIATMTWSEVIAVVLLGLLAGFVIFVLYRSIGIGFVM